MNELLLVDKLTTRLEKLNNEYNTCMDYDQDVIFGRISELETVIELIELYTHN